MATAFTLYFAKLAGLYFVIVSVVLIVRKQAMVELIPRIVEDAPLMLMAGMIRVIIGLAVLIGIGGSGSTTLPIVVALIGWITLLRGLAMLLLPQDQERRLIAVFKTDAGYYAAAAVVFALGLYLARAGFSI